MKNDTDIRTPVTQMSSKAVSRITPCTLNSTRQALIHSFIVDESAIDSIILVSILTDKDYGICIV